MAANSLAGEEAFKALPDMKISVRQVFGIDSDMEVPAFSQADDARAGDRSRIISSTATRRSPFSPASPRTAA